MNKALIAIAAALFCAQPALAGIKIEKKPMKTVAKAALVSVTIDNIGSGSASDQKLLGDAAGYALSLYAPGLKALGKWEMPDAPALAELEAAVSTLETSPVTLKLLDTMAMQNKLPGNFDPKDMMALAMASMSGKKDKLEALKGKMIASTAKELQADLNALRAKLVGAGGTAVLPYSLLAGRNLSPKEDALRQILDLILQDYCVRHGLDGVILVHHAAQTGSPGDIRVIVGGNRILSTIKINPTLLLRTKDGSMAIDAGQPRLDDLAPMKWAMPIFTGEKQPDGNFGNFKLDLADPAGKAKAACDELVKDTSADLLKDLAKKLK